MAEYGQSLFSAVYRFPLRAAFALLPPRGERLGRRASGPGHGARASLRKRAEVKAWITENFTIVPTLPDHG